MEFTDYQKRVAAWLVIACVFVLMLWLLGAVLTPFIVGAVLAYALNPAVTHFEAACRGRMPRWAAVMLVMTVFLLAVTGLVMLIVPVILKEAPIMRQQLPMLVDRGGAWTQQMLNRFGVPFQFNFSSLRDLMLRAMSNGDSSTVGSSPPPLPAAMLEAAGLLVPQQVTVAKKQGQHIGLQGLRVVDAERLAALEVERDTLRQNMELARTRVEALIGQLPEEE